MVSQYVDFQLIWDTAYIKGYVPGNQIIIYWEENGGGFTFIEKHGENLVVLQM